MKSTLKSIATATAIIAGPACFAQDTETAPKNVLSPYFYVKSDDPATDRLPLKSTSASVRIAGVIAGVTIEQVYVNEGKRVLEAVYNFPASTGAAVFAMEMKVGQRIITARIEEKQKARDAYEAARQEGRRASLLEQQRPNVLQMNVANILPGDSIAVLIRYTELLTPANGLYTFVFPTVVGPRYSNELRTEANVNSFVGSPYQHERELPFYNFGIDLTIAAGLPLQEIVCNTHKVNVRYDDRGKAHVSLDASESKGGNRDFVLEYRLAGEKIQSGLMLYEQNDEKFFLLMLQPPKRVAPADIPPREYIFINDVSGSMSGYPMDVSKKIMRNLVTGLRPEDRFNVLVFAGSSGWMAPQSLPANPENIAKAVAFIDHQRGGGGTELLPALQKALSFPRPYEETSRSFVVVTDGYVTVEQQAFDLIRERAGEANTFTFGIGSSVNRHLIEGMAHAGMGEPFIVLNTAETNEKAEQFRQYITSPVLSRVTSDYSGFEAYDTEPLALPDVFADRPVIIFGKYRGDAHGKISVKGYSGRNKWEATIDVSAAMPDADHMALRYLWARSRIRTLADYGRAGRKDSIREQVTALGLKYNLLTDYTSFVAIEETPVYHGEFTTVKQPFPMPLNVSNAAVGLDMAVEMEEMSLTKGIRFHQEIRFLTELHHTAKKPLREYIEKAMKERVTVCMETALETRYIEIRVSAGGRVSRIRVDGQDAARLEKCIAEWAAALDFGKIYMGKEWTFRIVL